MGTCLYVQSAHYCYRLGQAYPSLAPSIPQSIHSSYCLNVRAQSRPGRGGEGGTGRGHGEGGGGRGLEVCEASSEKAEGSRAAQ